MRQLLVREQCLQREQKLAHSNKQQLPSSLTVPKSGHHNNSKHEMATTTIAITRAAAASNSAPRQWQPPTPPPHPSAPPSATTPVVTTSSSSLPPLSNSRHPKSAKASKGNSPATVAETNQVLRLKNPTTYHVLQSQKRRQELLTSNAVASSSGLSCYDQNACRGDVVASTASTTRNPEAALVAGVEAHVGHKHLLYPPKTTTTSAFMTKSAPEILPGEGMSPTSSGLLPPAAETISSVASATSAASAASAAALAASAACALPTTHFSSSAPEPNQVQSQRKNKSDTASASSAVAPKGINYSCGSHAASPTSIEVRPCHRSFRVSGLEAVPEEAEGGGP